MNVIFSLLFILSCGYMVIVNPNGVLTSLNNGAERALRLSFTLMIIYCVWLGVFQIIIDSKLSNKFAKALNKPIIAIFGKMDEESLSYISLNITANFLGLGSVATPLGIKAAKSLEEHNNKFAACMLFVIASTSIQLIPTTVISLRQSFNSLSPHDILIPSLLTTFISTAIGIILTKIFIKK